MFRELCGPVRSCTIVLYVTILIGMVCRTSPTFSENFAQLLINVPQIHENLTSHENLTRLVKFSLNLIDFMFWTPCNPRKVMHGSTEYFFIILVTWRAPITFMGLCWQIVILFYSNSIWTYFGQIFWNSLPGWSTFRGAGQLFVENHRFYVLYLLQPPESHARFCRSFFP